MKNVLITGGAGGIGSEIVKIFTDNMFHVYLVDIDMANATKIVNDVGKEKCTFINLSVTDVAAIQNYCKTLDSKFSLDHIITMAGRALDNEWVRFEEQKIEDISKSISLNLLGQINIIHAFYPYLKKANGDKSILMISSINAIGNFGLPAYSAAKSGLYGFVNAVIKEFGEDSIRINTLSPGTIVTPATLNEPKDFEALLKVTALGKFTTAHDVARLAYEICAEFTTMTGQNITLDAGQSKLHI